MTDPAVAAAAAIAPEQKGTAGSHLRVVQDSDQELQRLKEPVASMLAASMRSARSRSRWPMPTPMSISTRSRGTRRAGIWSIMIWMRRGSILLVLLPPQPHCRN
jgi:hypothetical protein